MIFFICFLLGVPPPAGKGMNHRGRGAVPAPKENVSKNRALSAGEYAPI